MGRTAQEDFWAGDFGDAYTDRNDGVNVLASKLELFAKILAHTRGIDSVLEIGSNRGLNLRALKAILPKLKMEAIEINEKAASECMSIPDVTVFNGSAFEYNYSGKLFDLSFTSGILIHTAPKRLGDMYRLLYETSRKYILVSEYYNPSPITINYRGYENKLFKRDFCGEMMEHYSALELIDYGFIYHRDNNYPMDDVTWFLMEKR